MTKPTKDEINKFIIDGETLQKNRDKRDLMDPLKPQPDDFKMVIVPDIPVAFIELSRRIVKNSNLGSYPTLERAIQDPGDANMDDVLRDLRRAASALSEPSAAR